MKILVPVKRVIIDHNVRQPVKPRTVADLNVVEMAQESEGTLFVRIEGVA